jgi:acetyl esterase/lipase
LKITALFTALMLFADVAAFAVDETPESRVWRHNPELMRPFWEGDTVRGEPVLFIRNTETGEATASLLFPVQKILSVADSTDWNSPEGTKYEEGRDFIWNPGSREITLPANSRIPSFTPDELRRQPGSQQHKLTHRDGNGEIFFGAKTEYHRMQTCVSYQHEPQPWPTPVPSFDENALPRTIQSLRHGEPVSIVLIGDSISTGCNASGWGGAPPFQPAFPELLLQHLETQFLGQVTLMNLSVGGTSTPWGLEQVPNVVESHPDLVILAFGMNDASGRSAAEYHANTLAIMSAVRKQLPNTEFILVASMLGNRDWTTLKHDLFPQYRDALEELVEPGIALADMTSIWTEFFRRKPNRDLTGNGVNHPNDFGHRVYAQVLARLLSPETAENPVVVPLWNNRAAIGDGQFEESHAVMTLHPATTSNSSVIVICPGGGYGGLVTGAEGHGIASWLNSHGISGAVLEYRLPNGRHQVPLLDAQRAIRTLRANATEWDLNPSEVGIMGFSAGGHLAGTAATHFDDGDPNADELVERQSCRPDFAVLVYPVVTMGEQTHAGSRDNLLGPEPAPELIELFSTETQVRNNTPPMFLAHAVDDTAVSSNNSQMLFDALQAKNIPSQYLELPSGGHGLNGYQGPMWDTWQKQSLHWLATMHMIRLDEPVEQ